jgi:hypothetical protein
VVAAVVAPMQASISIVPLLFLAYVAYAIFTAIAKASRAARQAQSAQQQSQQQPPAASTMDAQQMRSVLVQRAQALAAQQAAARAAARAAAQTAVRPQPPPQPSPQVSVSLQPQPLAPTPEAATAWDLSVMPLMTDPYATIGAAPVRSSQSVDFASALSLPPAALAIVARAVIGPCAAHTGAGHNPEDW